MAQHTIRNRIASAGSHRSAPLIAFATIATAWPAAGYGALVIWAAGDFASTGTLWIFGWPFLTQLLCATTLHLLAVGAGSRWGIPPLVAGIDAFDEARARLAAGTCDRETLRAGLDAAVRFPMRNECIGLGLSALVTTAAALLEWFAAGVASPNVPVIVRGGLYATVLYGAASLAVSELLTRPTCHALRRAAVASNIDPYEGVSLAHGWRIAAAVVPTVVALVVAVEIGLSARGSTVAYVALTLLSALLAAALNWLQYEGSRRAVRELGDACRDLAAGREWGLITGSVEPMFQKMAREFTAAARHVGADRRDSGERYRAVFEAALDCIITMDHEGRIVEFNPAAEQTFGYTRAQVVGQPMVEKIVPPRLRARQVEGLARYLETGRSGVLGRRIEVPALRADGTEFSAEVAISCIERDGPPIFTAHLRDITARKRAEEALTATTVEAEEQAEIASALLRVGETMNARLSQPDLLERLSRVTVEALGCDASTIFVWDRDRRAFVLGANVGSQPAVVAEVQQLEFTAERFAVVGALRAGELLELPDVAHSIFPAALAERWRIAALLAAPISRGGEILGVIVATYRERCGPFSPKQRRLALGAAHAAAIALENSWLIGDLRAASQMKTEFVSTMSHELRTPLNVILGFCEMLRDQATTGMEREVCHQRIELAARILLELVESTLEVGRLETGRDEPALEPVELVPMWEKLGREYAVLPRRGAVGLEWSTCPAGVVVQADPRRLAMIVRNLVSNALKFTDEGFVRAEAFLDGLDIVLRVSDSGIGIAPADQEKVFEMFCQGDGSDSRRHGGTGLGLYIVRRFSAQFGGTVELESAPGRGSIFTVRLPVARIVRQTPLPSPRPSRVSDHDERV